MNNNENRRAHVRFKCEVPVVILRETTRMLSLALMKNFSVGGFYFEVSDPLSEGDYIIFKADSNPVPGSTGSDTGDERKAQVKWCMERGRGKAPKYGCGAQYV